MINLQKFISLKIRNIFLALVLVSLVIETGFGLFILIEARKTERNQLFSEFKSVLRDPINQGSHIEAYARLERYIGKNGIQCISLEIDDNVPMGKCLMQQIPYSIRLNSSDFLGSGSVTINVWIDDSDLWKKQFLLFLSRTTYYVLALLILSFFLRKNILKINYEIQVIKNRFNNQFENSAMESLSIEEFQDLSETLEDLTKKIKESEKQRAVLEVAKKVSHDIRSPLSALNIISSRISQVLPEEGQLLNTASVQILKIAEDLLETNRQSTKSEQSCNWVFPKSDIKDQNGALPDISASELAAVCKEVFLLKEIEYRERSNARLSFYNSVSTSKKIQVDSHQLKRIISNLLNNSIESISQNGFVSLNLEEDNSSFIVEIRDSGKGMSQDLIEKVYRHPVTEGKERGNGLGLHNSIKIIEGWSGKIDICSKPGIGTTISIRLPVISS